MPIHLFNTLSNQVEPLLPADGAKLRLYACGPTVYDYGHIGNFRTFLHVDILRRALELGGMEVEHVMNITDVDDKIIRNATAAGLPIADYTRRFEEGFFEDLDTLGVEKPSTIARATEHIPEMVELIEQLRDRGLAYQADDGSWYFRIAGFPSYGKLSKKDLSGMTDGARVDVDEYDKDSARDFALWKAAKAGEHFWSTTLGPGRPGWHIECSAMATRYLGQPFDLHAGGEDLMFPHHENEIAQSEGATGQAFARHWFHVRFLLVEGRKMSKSEGNFYTLRDLLLKGYKASAIRSLLVSVPYGQQLNFTFEGLAAETAAVERLRAFGRRIDTLYASGRDNAQSLNQELLDATTQAGTDFIAALEHDLNTAEARAAIFDLVRKANAAADADKLYTQNAAAILKVLADFDFVFQVLIDRDGETTGAALDWAEAEGRLDQVPAELLAQRSLSDAQINSLVDERIMARHTRNFARSDAIRDELLAKGIVLEDTKLGVNWRRR